MRRTAHLSVSIAALVAAPALLAQPPAGPGGPGGPGQTKPLPLEPKRTAAFTATKGTWMSLDVSPDGATIVFDGLSGVGHGPDGFEGQARVPDHLLDLVVEAAEECPAECIYLEAS